MSPKSYTLLQLNSLVRMAVERTLTGEYWVEAELAECRERGGHCYMELVQKEEAHSATSRSRQDGTLVARASAKCWRSQWALLQPYFERIAQQPLRAGLKVKLKVYPQFHEAYGFSWIVTDIDPTFTLGDMARRRQEIIDQLKQEGVFDLQKDLQLPLFCQRIAVISSESAAGYGDFVNQLADNGRDLRFVTRLFPAIMQGEQVEQSVIDALNRIFAEADQWDCVVIIRGGGATSDLSGFDTLALAENVAQFPLPIITGIGHDRDESILDMVSHQRVKTPTAAAALLVSHLGQVLDRVLQAEERVARYALQRMEVERLRLSRLAERIPVLFSLVRTRHEARLDRLAQTMTAVLRQRIDRENTRLQTFGTQLFTMADRRLLQERHRLELLQQRATALDPALLLQRGYSITLVNGRALRRPADAPPGTVVETRLAEGTLHSQVINTPLTPSKQ